MAKGVSEGIWGTYHFCGGPAGASWFDLQNEIFSHAKFVARRRPSFVRSRLPNIAARCAVRSIRQWTCKKIGRVFDIETPSWEMRLPEVVTAILNQGNSKMSIKGVILAGGSGTRLYPC